MLRKEQENLEAAASTTNTSSTTQSIKSLQKKSSFAAQWADRGKAKEASDKQNKELTTKLLQLLSEIIPKPLFDKSYLTYEISVSNTLPEIFFRGVRNGAIADTLWSCLELNEYSSIHSGIIPKMTARENNPTPSC